jgi:hypothetical protein
MEEETQAPTESQESIESPEGQESPLEQPKQQNDDSMARRLEIISRRERELMNREQAYRAEISKYQNMEREMLDYKNKLRELDELDKDPVSVLGRRGWDIDKIAEKFSSQHEPIAGEEKKSLYSKLDEMQAYIKKMEGDLTQRDERQLEERRSQVKNRLYADMRAEASKEPDKYELVDKEDAYDTVFQLMDDHYQKTQKALSIQEAMEQVENYLDSEYSKRLKYKKIQSKFMNQNEDYLEPEPQQDYRPSTLTNNLSQTIPPQSNRPLTREESLRRAAALIQFND